MYIHPLQPQSAKHREH